MSISSTGLYGSTFIVHSDLFNDVEALKEQVPVLSVSYILFYSCNSIITHVLSKQGWAIC